MTFLHSLVMNFRNHLNVKASITNHATIQSDFAGFEIWDTMVLRSSILYVRKWYTLSISFQNKILGGWDFLKKMFKWSIYYHTSNVLPCIQLCIAYLNFRIRPVKCDFLWFIFHKGLQPMWHFWRNLLRETLNSVSKRIDLFLSFRDPLLRKFKKRCFFKALSPLKIEFFFHALFHSLRCGGISIMYIGWIGLLFLPIRI